VLSGPLLYREGRSAGERTDVSKQDVVGASGESMGEKDAVGAVLPELLIVTGLWSVIILVIVDLIDVVQDATRVSRSFWSSSHTSPREAPKRVEWKRMRRDRDSRLAAWLAGERVMN
jgi:hypothetical protein